MDLKLRKGSVGSGLVLGRHQPSFAAGAAMCSASACTDGFGT